jgi:hypothetical protein
MSEDAVTPRPAPPSSSLCQPPEWANQTSPKHHPGQTHSQVAAQAWSFEPSALQAAQACSECLDWNAHYLTSGQ